MVGRRYFRQRAYFQVEHVSFRECICTDFVEYDGVFDGFYRCLCEQWRRSLLLKGWKYTVQYLFPLWVNDLLETTPVLVLDALLMEDILHQLVVVYPIIYIYLQDFIHARWCRMSSINSSKGIWWISRWKWGFHVLFPWKFVRQNKHFDVTCFFWNQHIWSNWQCQGL